VVSVAAPPDDGDVRPDVFGHSARDLTGNWV
jgi:hypothetical protein